MGACISLALVFLKRGKSKNPEKTSGVRTRTNNILNPLMTPGPEFKLLHCKRTKRIVVTDNTGSLCIMGVNYKVLKEDLTNMNRNWNFQ